MTKSIGKNLLGSGFFLFGWIGVQFGGSLPLGVEIPIYCIWLFTTWYWISCCIVHIFEVEARKDVVFVFWCWPCMLILSPLALISIVIDHFLDIPFKIADYHRRNNLV